MSEIEALKEEIALLKERNKRVESNKAWEISLTRKITIILLTYIVMVLTLTTIQNPNPIINAIIPTLGFFLSTVSIPFVKHAWKKHLYKK